jgi:hypothetical protein
MCSEETSNSSGTDDQWVGNKLVQDIVKVGSANGNRTRISALKGPRANRCTIAPQLWKRKPR